MALVIKINKTAISSDCVTVTIADQTGNYDVTTNPSGYGAPNETRANLYIKLFVTLKTSAGDINITVPAYNENTASSWTVTISQDGWYEIFAFACRAWSNATTYSLGHIVYDAGTDKFYKSLQDTNLNHSVGDGAWWKEATIVQEFADAINAAQPNTYSSTDNVAELCNSGLCFARSISKSDCCNDCDPCVPQKHEKIRWKMEQVTILEAEAEFTKAQAIIETIQNICGCDTE